MSILPFPESATENGGQAGYGDEFDIPKGTYSACLIDASTKVFFFGRSPKVVLTFRILDMGSYFGKEVRGFYAVKRIKGKPRRNGTFEVGPRSRLLRDLSKLIDSRPPTDHVPESIIDAGISEIEVRLVDVVSGEKLTESMQYAVVERIIRRLQG